MKLSTITIIFIVLWTGVHSQLLKKSSRESVGITDQITSFQGGGTSQNYLSVFGEDSVAVVDSVFEKNGRKHIRLDYELQIRENYEQLLFIEGIGPNAGLLYQVKSLTDNSPFSQILLCVSQDALRVYREEKLSNQNCAFDDGIIGINNSIQNMDFLIYFNPVENSLEIEFDKDKPYTKLVIEVFDSMGSRICRKDSKENSIKLPCRNRG
jgi:hypothetical protein